MPGVIQVPCWPGRGLSAQLRITRPNASSIEKRKRDDFRARARLRGMCTSRNSSTPRSGGLNQSSGSLSTGHGKIPCRYAATIDAGSLAIPDYDGLAASQVLNRLAGLSDDELRAVHDYEAAHRARKTILTRAIQLLAASAR